jgi:3-oxoacyl-[acyl-carrier protein] reductase
MGSEGRTALVTGASRGIGRAIALELGQRGAAVVVNYQERKDEAEEVVHLLSKAGVEALALAADVSREPEVADLRRALLREFPRGVDILVNNAGIHQHLKSWELPVADWQRILDVNLTGPFLSSKAFLPEMKERRWGRVINLSSIVGLTGTDHEIHYGSSKAAILGFTKSLAREVARWGITVNAIAPGTVKTDMTASMTREEVEANLRYIPLGRLGNPEDIAHAAAFLASEEASWITGETLHVNGGEFMA